MRWRHELAKGKPRPLATRARQSAAGKKAWADPELRARQSEGLKKVWADPELRARQSAVSKKAWADPEKRARRSAALKKAWADPELRARQSERLKKAWADPELDRLRTENAQLHTTITAVRELHKSFDIYDQCEHGNEEHDGAVLIDEIGYTCNLIYHICSECCMGGNEMGEWCLDHDHGLGKPICATIATLDKPSSLVTKAKEFVLAL